MLVFVILSLLFLCRGAGSAISETDCLRFTQLLFRLFQEECENIFLLLLPGVTLPLHVFLYPTRSPYSRDHEGG